ncbi:GNAT family N-acetyltransferase [Streptomyces carminius]|uniref:GNAT family N-acetyltransferase n=1 Tax=Streptomyces carminius TaxID=2665496 RepID=A0A2M8LQN8_9ACTN|nr:GNAT family N-acetyltransferase [Streptomyces carminius]PJE94250.1 GNAT family N-acetyltransferase [Streptomyces carminius]
MPELIVPTVRVHASFVAAIGEFEAEGRGAADDNSILGQDIRRYGGRWDAPEVFARYVAAVRADAEEDGPRPAGHVPCTTRWWADGDTYLGRIAIRHRLTTFLLDYGGHIGYDVRPSVRRRGHATAMLRAALPVARALGIEKALITCDDTNEASRRVIEACGGVFEDRRGKKLRYWVATGPVRDRPGVAGTTGE